MSTGTLFLIPTVISIDSGNTIPGQVSEAIQQVDFFLVENLRTARRYISSLKLGLVIEDLHFELLDKRTSQSAIRKMLGPLNQGKNIGVISESGCPGIADPGALAVACAHEMGKRVIPLVGPSSLIMALMASGFNGQRFAFHGYLPIDKKQLVLSIKKVESESGKLDQTQIFIEAPYRNNQLLKALISACQPHTRLSVSCDVTGENEFIRSTTIKEWKNINVDLHKRPTVFMIYAHHI